MGRRNLDGRLKCCDSKAIVGAADVYKFPSNGPLKPCHFSSCEATVIPKLQALGFEVIRIDEDWSHDEFNATVSTYFEMLLMEG